MPNRHKYRLMRPHSNIAAQLPGDYPETINASLRRYLAILNASLPSFLEAEWNLMREACNGWATQMEPPETLHSGLCLQIEDAIGSENLDEKWGVNNAVLMERLSRLTIAEAIAVIHEIEKYWKSVN